MWNEASAMPIPTSTPTLNLSETAALRHDRERVEEKDSDTSLSDLDPATSEPPDNATERLGSSARVHAVRCPLRARYLRHDGPEHVLAFAPTRSG
jgi:hypothetical protein